MDARFLRIVSFFGGRDGSVFSGGFGVLIFLWLFAHGLMLYIGRLCIQRCLHDT